MDGQMGGKMRVGSDRGTDGRGMMKVRSDGGTEGREEQGEKGIEREK